MTASSRFRLRPRTGVSLLQAVARALSGPGVMTLVSRQRPLPLSSLHEGAEAIDKAQSVDASPLRLEQCGGADEVGQAACAADRHVEAITAEQEADVAWPVLAARRRHREEHHRGFLALKAVDGS